MKLMTNKYEWYANQQIKFRQKYRNYKFIGGQMMEQILKGPKKFEISDNQMLISHNMRKQMRIPRAMQVIGENLVPQNDQFHSIKPQKIKCPQLAIPYQMSRTFINYMLFYRIMSYLVGFSLILSLLQVYGNSHHYFLTITNNAITFSILIASSIKLKLYCNHLLSKKQNINTLNLCHIILQILITIPHPTIWTMDSNTILHLLLILRISIIIKYQIESSIYCNVRAYRIININGLNSSQHFFFAVKSLVQSLNFAQILGIWFMSVLVFTHCLYLAGLSSGSMLRVFDCFQIVMITIPTVGFGEYELPFISQKIIISLTVVTGAVFNSFVTLSMLSQLKMNQNQISSYMLFKKISTRECIENISKKYIQKSINRIRMKNLPNQQSNKYINFSFRNQYRTRKSLYNSISYTDINNLFSYYSDRLVQFKISTLQTANMVSVLLRALARHKTKVEKQRKTQLYRIQ